MNIQTIILVIDSYNRILCSLLTNETVEVIALISSGRVFHRILPLYFIDRWKHCADSSFDFVGSIKNFVYAAVI